MFNLKSTIVFALLLAFPGAAYAYVDPGTGAYLLQLLIAVFGAVVFYASRPKQLWRLIKDYFIKRKEK